VQVDYPDGRRTTDVLSGVWTYSNCPFLIALPSQRSEAILEGMKSAFEFFGCVPREVWRDKIHLAVALGQAACRAGRRVKFYTAQALVNQLEEAQKNYRLERMLTMLGRIELLIVDELGYISFSRSGAELLFQVFADRYERGSILITSNLPFGE